MNSLTEREVDIANKTICNIKAGAKHRRGDFKMRTLDTNNLNGVIEHARVRESYGLVASTVPELLMQDGITTLSGNKFQTDNRWTYFATLLVTHSKWFCDQYGKSINTYGRTFAREQARVTITEMLQVYHENLLGDVLIGKFADERQKIRDDVRNDSADHLEIIELTEQFLDWLCPHASYPTGMPHTISHQVKQGFESDAHCWIELANPQGASTSVHVKTRGEDCTYDINGELKHIQTDAKLSAEYCSKDLQRTISVNGAAGSIFYYDLATGKARLAMSPTSKSENAEPSESQYDYLKELMHDAVAKALATTFSTVEQEEYKNPKTIKTTTMHDLQSVL